MKLRNLAFTLTAAALLPTFAFAGYNTDAISASFDRDIKREFSVRYVPAAVTKADPLDVINVTLRAGPDPVLASFERELYRESIAFKTLPASSDADPLDAINVALRCEYTDFINASINPELNHC